MTGSRPATFGKYSLRQNYGGASDSTRPGTEGGLDLAIQGNGYFVVRNAETNEYYATQSGVFSIDDNGYLLAPSGARLQGRTGSDLSPVGDLQVNAAGLPTGTVPRAAMLCYTIDDMGRISVQLSDGSAFLCGQILLQNFEQPQALVHGGDGFFSNVAAAGPLPEPAVPGSNGLGAIQAGTIELAIFNQARWQN
jgi:flagellar hook protein FlgE